MPTLTRVRVLIVQHHLLIVMAPTTRSVYLLPGGRGSLARPYHAAVSSVIRTGATTRSVACSASMRRDAAHVSGDTCAAGITLAVPCVGREIPVARTP